MALDNVEKVLVARELHEDGNQHFHALVSFKSKTRISNARYFDFMGHHPEVEKHIKSMNNWIKYITKHNEFLNHGYDLNKIKQVTEVIREQVEQGASASTATAATVTQMGDRALKMIHQVERYAQLISTPQTIHSPEFNFPDDFNIEGPVQVAITRFYNNMMVPTRGRGTNMRSLWLYGPSRMGKTSLARSLGPHWYMMGMWMVDQLNSTVKYGVMDDIDWEYLKINYKGMLGSQKDVTVTDKYRKKSIWPGGMPVIVCSNELPEFNQSELDWLHINVDFVRVGEAVFAPARVADAAIVISDSE